VIPLFCGYIVGDPDLLFGCIFEERIADRAADQPDRKVNQAPVFQERELVEDLLLPNIDPPVPGPAGELTVPGEEDPALPFCPSKEFCIFLWIAGGKAIRTLCIIAEEPEVPGEGAEHPIHKEPEFRGHLSTTGIR